MRLSDALVTGLVVAVLTGAVVALRPSARLISGAARVVDGDTLAFGTRRVRLVGMDAPELDQTCGVPDRLVACGRAARDEMTRLLAQGPLACRVVGRDRYGRDLARCSAGGVDLGAALVREGWAISYGGYEADESRARTAHAGLWAAPFERPSDWRRAHPHAGY